MEDSGGLREELAEASLAPREGASLVPAEATGCPQGQGAGELPVQVAAPEPLPAWEGRWVLAKHPLSVQARATTLERARTQRKVGKGRTIGSWTKFEAIKVSSP